MDFRIEFDIWNNVTYIKDGDLWYKQIFLENELIKYEDSNGNYWSKEFGTFPYLLITFDITYLYSNSQLTNYGLECECSDTHITYQVIYIFKISQNILRMLTIDIASELVPVQPMSPPTQNLYYLDYTYKGETWFQKIKRKINLVMSKIYRIFVPYNLKNEYYE